MSDKKDGEAYVSDYPVYHNNKRYGPGQPLPAGALKGIHEDLVRKATKAELKALEDSDSGDEQPSEEPAEEEQPAAVEEA